MKSEANLLLEIHLRELGLHFIPEYQFHPERKWRFDYILVRSELAPPIAIEIEGGTWMKKARHTSGAGYLKDMEKYREAAISGWRVLRFSTGEVLTGVARAFLEKHCL